MSAIALTAEEAEVIARANAALAWIRGDDFPWPFDSGLIKAYAAGLEESLGVYAGLTSTPPRIHPAAEFPHLGRGQDNALELALDLVTEDIRAWTRELVRLGNLAEEAARALEEGKAA